MHDVFVAELDDAVATGDTASWPVAWIAMVLVEASARDRASPRRCSATL
jgi:hypothetical protein